MAKEIAKLFVTLGLDSKDFQTQLKRIDKDTRAMGKTMAVAGAAIVAGIGVAINAWAKAGNEVQKLALKTGFSTEAISEWRHAIEISGGEVGNLQMAVRTMSSAIMDANDGLKTYQRSFEHLNLDYKELKRMAPEEAFERVAMAIGRLSSSTEKAALAQDIFGRGGMEMIPLLEQGAEGIAALRQEAHDLGIVFDQQAADKAAQFVDTLDRLKKAIKGVSYEIASNAAPTIQSYAEIITDATKRVSKFSKEHPELSYALTNTAMNFGAVTLAMGGLILAFPKLLQMGNALKLGFGKLSIYATMLTAGLTLMGTGISMLIQNHQRFQEMQEGSIRLSKEYEKALNGEKNELKEVLLAQADAVEIYTRSSGMSKEAKQEQYDWAIKAREAVEVLTREEEKLQAEYDSAIDKINAYYGTYEEKTRSAQDLARDARDARISYLDDELDKLRELYDEKISLYEEDYHRAVSALEKKYQDQIDAIDAQEKAEERARRRHEAEEDVRSLKLRISSERDAAYRAGLEEDLARKLDDIREMELGWRRDDERAALRDRIQAVRDGTDAEVKALREATDAKVAAEDEWLKKLEVSYARQKIDADAALQQSLLNIQVEKEARIKAWDDWYNDAMDKLKNIIILQQGPPIAESKFPWLKKTAMGFGALGPLGAAMMKLLPGYDVGGIVPGPVGAPVPAIVHGGETITPPGTSTITQHFNISQLVVREEADVQKIARELYRMSQTRL